nr:thymidine phosphorylase [Hydrogenophaga sp.]
LDSGRALAQMRAIVEAQGSRHFDHHHPALAPLTLDVTADAEGVVTGIDNLQIARVARLAGAPKVPGAGLDLLKKLGDPVRVGEPLYRVHASYPSDLEFSRRAIARASGYRIGRADEVPQVFVEF